MTRTTRAGRCRSAMAARAMLAAWLGCGLAGSAMAQANEQERVARADAYRQLLAARQAEAVKARAATEKIVGLDGAELGSIDLTGLDVLQSRYSPDLGRFAAELANPETESTDIWVFDSATGKRTRLTSSGEREEVFGFAWSADASELVFTALRGSQYNIYRRKVDGPADSEGELVYSNEGGDIILNDWSPDGRYVIYSSGFVTSVSQGGRLYRLDLVSGGEPVLLLQTAAPIVASKLSPDGRYIAYVEFRDGAYAIGVTRAEPAPGGENETWTLATRSDTNGRWSPDGRELFYCEEDRMIAIPVDTGGETFRHGEPREMAPPAAVTARYPDIGCFGRSRDGERLRFTVRPDPALERIAMFDRAGREIARFGQPAVWDSPSFSPDGSRILAQKFADADAFDSEFRIFDARSGEGAPIPGAIPLKFGPTWMAGGDHFAFEGLVMGSGGEVLVYRRRADGAGEAELLHRSEPGVISVNLADVSPDGEYLALNIAAYAAAVPLADADPEKRTEIDILRAEFDVGALRFSPDMRFVAYTYDESGRPEVYLAPFDAETGAADQGRSRQISHGGAAGGLAWRADGKELYYLGERLDTPELNDFGVMAVGVATGPALETGEPRELFAIDLPTEVTAARNMSGGVGRQLFWRIASPDGQRFLLVQSAKPGGEGETTP